MTMEYEEMLEKLGPFRAGLQRSVQPYVEITPQPGATRPEMSKFGGSAYMPEGAAYPLDEAGKPMRLLAQINFAEVPPLALFPESGLLQFFISADDELYGLSFDDPCGQRNFKVVYIPPAAMTGHTSNGAGSGAAVDGADTADNGFPVERELALSFALKEAAVGSADFQFARFFGQGPFVFFEQFGEDESAMGDAYADAYGGVGHKIGGYAFFTQTDPRENSYEDYEVLLLQIDTDDEHGIMWGDSGVANFFIRPADLQNRDFSKVLYNWDCC